MPENPQEHVTCPACGQHYRWREALVGKTVPCKKCDEPFAVPVAPGRGLAIESAVPTPEPESAPPAPDQQAQEEDDGTYDLDLSGLEDHEGPATGGSSPPPPAAEHKGNCPQCNSPLPDHAVVCVNCGFNSSVGKAIETEVSDPPKPKGPAGSETDAAPPPTKMSKEAKREAARIAAAEEEHLRALKKQKKMIVIGVVIVIAIIVLAIVI